MNSNESDRTGKPKIERFSFDFLGIDFGNDAPLTRDQIKDEIMPHLVKILVVAGESEQKARSRIENSLGQLITPKEGMSDKELETFITHAQSQEHIRRILGNINEVVKYNFENEKRSTSSQAPKKATLILRDAIKSQPVEDLVSKDEVALDAPVQDLVPDAVLSDTNVEEKEKFVLGEKQSKILRDVREMYNTVRKQRDEFLGMGPENNKMRFFVFNSQFDGYQGVLRGYRALQKRINVYHKRAKEQNKLNLELSETEIDDLKERYDRLKMFFDRTQRAVEAGEVTLHKKEVTEPIKVIEVENTSPVLVGPTLDVGPSVELEVHKAEPLAPEEEKKAFETIPSPIGAGVVIDAGISSGEKPEQREFSPRDSVLYTTKGGVQIQATVTKELRSDWFRIEWEENGTRKTSLANGSELSLEMTPSSVDSTGSVLDSALPTTKPNEEESSTTKPGTAQKRGLLSELTNELRRREAVGGNVDPGTPSSESRAIPVPSTDDEHSDPLFSLLKRIREEGSEGHRLKRGVSLNEVVPDPDAATSSEKAEALKQVTNAERFKRAKDFMAKQREKFAKEKEAILQKVKSWRLLEKISTAFKNQKKTMRWGGVGLAALAAAYVATVVYENGNDTPPVASIEKLEPNPEVHDAGKPTIVMPDTASKPAVSPELPKEKDLLKSSDGVPVTTNVDRVVGTNGKSTPVPKTETAPLERVAPSVSPEHTEPEVTTTPETGSEMSDEDYAKIRERLDARKNNNSPKNAPQTEVGNSGNESVGNSTVVPSPDTYEEKWAREAPFNIENFSYPVQLADGSYREATEEEIRTGNYIGGKNEGGGGKNFEKNSSDFINTGLLVVTEKDLGRVDKLFDSAAGQYFDAHNGDTRLIPKGVTKGEYVAVAGRLLDELRIDQGLLDAFSWQEKLREDMRMSDYVVAGQVFDLNPFFEEIYQRI